MYVHVDIYHLLIHSFTSLSIHLPKYIEPLCVECWGNEDEKANPRPCPGRAFNLLEKKDFCFGHGGSQFWCCSEVDPLPVWFRLIPSLYKQGLGIPQAVSGLANSNAEQKQFCWVGLLVAVLLSGFFLPVSHHLGPLKLLGACLPALAHFGITWVLMGTLRVSQSEKV